jgi:hypothetical protein
MKQENLYVNQVDKCSKVRYEINEDLYKKGMNPLQKIAFYLVGIETHDYKLIHDMNYYKGGYPKEETPPKLHTFLNKFIVVVKWFQFMGWFEKIDKYLREAGISIVITMPIEDGEIFQDYKGNSKDSKKFIKAWSRIYPEQEPETKFKTVRAVMDECLERSYDIQKDICDLADSIKIDAAGNVESECEILKPHFMKAVVLKYKENKNAERGKGIEKEIKMVKAGIENLEDAISIFEE